MSAVLPDTRPFRGLEAMRRQWDEIWETFEGMRMDPLEVFDVGGRRFVVDVRMGGKGKRSGAEVDQPFAYLYTLRDSDNKIVRCQLFPHCRGGDGVGDSLGVGLARKLILRLFDACGKQATMRWS
jgi:hypothetical protein